MVETQFAIFIPVLIISLIVSLVFGILLFIRKQDFSDKQRKAYGIVLLGVGLLNFILFNMLIFSYFSNYTIREFISLIFLFVIPFLNGFVLISTRHINKGLRKVLGVLLIFLPVFWIIMIAASGLS